MTYRVSDAIEAQLTAEERERYSWQFTVPDFGEAGQKRLKAATVFISRIGGVGGTVAMQLAAAGIGRLILAHAGDIRLNDLNRQLLMTTEAIGTPRIDSAKRRLRELNPHVEIETIGENANAANAARLTNESDLIVAAAPLFEERLVLNREAVLRGIPLVDCAMYELEARLTTVIPGQTACLSCLYPEPPAQWKRQFPVFSAVASMIGCVAALEVIKLIAGLGQTLSNRLLVGDLRTMRFHDVPISRDPGCPVCAATRQNA